MSNKVILVTGASSGMGFETAKTLAQQGNKVYGAARRVEKMAALKEYGVTPLLMRHRIRLPLQKLLPRKAGLMS